MRQLARLGVTTLLVGGLVVGAAATLGAQYPIEGVDDCAETFDGAGEEATTFARGDDIQVRGQAGCAEPNEPRIEAILESDPVLLARFNANADGSYTSPVATIPGDVSTGVHEIVVRTSDDEYVQPIRITAAGVPSALPDTGQDISTLVLWGVLSFAGGFALVTASRRLRPAPVRRPTPRAVPVLPQAGPPRRRPADRDRIVAEMVARMLIVAREDRLGSGGSDEREETSPTWNA